MKYLIVAVALLTAGCTDAEWSGVTSLGNKHVIELYSGGKMVRSWTSTGKVLTEAESDGYHFRDSATDEYVRVSGDVVVTAIGD
jgi:hypothetical protein